MSDFSKRLIAKWLHDTAYVVDWNTDVPLPGPLWEAFVDYVHEDPTGRWHGGELTRDEVAAWLALEAGRSE